MKTLLKTVIPIAMLLGMNAGNLLFSQVSRKFDFGSGPVAAGYTAVRHQMLFSDDRGYGFLDTSGLRDVSRKDRNALSADFVTGSRPFYFSVKVPEGNYRLTLYLGDTQGQSSQTVRVENRRLMLEKLKSNTGEILKTSFLVHVRTPAIAGSSDLVKLKPREQSYFHWDNNLTIEFNGEQPNVCGLEISAADANVTTVFLAGNSTVVDQAEEPYAAWGQMIPAFFKPSRVVVANYAESGETLKAFKRENRLAKILAQMKKGDYLFIEFAHNDQKPGGNHLDPFTTYKQELKSYISEVRKKGGIPVLVTSMHRRNFDEQNRIINTLGDYPEAVRQVGKEDGVPVVDLNAMSKTLYEAWGPELSLKAFVHYPANTFPGQTQKLEDNTHFTPYGAYELARCVALGVCKQVPGLAKELKERFRSFDPSQPDPLDSWNWPLSPQISVIKPDGN